MSSCHARRGTTATAIAALLLAYGCGATPGDAAGASSGSGDPSAPRAHATRPAGLELVESGDSLGTDPGAEGSGDTPEAPPSDGAPASSAAGFELLAKETTRELAAMSSSTYDHTTRVDEGKGVFDFDCSGFVGYALQRSVGDAMSALQAATEPRPLAKDFEGFVAAIDPGASSGRWHHVARAMDLVPGDIVAWLKPAAVTSSNTGHVMIVRGAPTVSGKRGDEILVPIADSTSTPHGPSDSRTPASATGLGTGTIGLLVDGSGAPWGYHWSGGYSATAYTTAIALGHLE